MNCAATMLFFSIIVTSVFARTVPDSDSSYSKKSYLYYDSMAFLSYPHDLRMVVWWLDKAITVSNADSIQLMQSFRRKGQVLNTLGQHREAIKSLTVARDYYTNNPTSHEALIIDNNLGCALTFTGEYSPAYKIFYETLNLLQFRNDDEILCMTYHNLAIIYYKNRNYSKAIQYFGKTLEQRKKANYKSQEMSVMSNLALCEAALNHHSKSLFLLDRINLANDSLTESEKIETAFAKGYLFLNMSQLNNAETHFKISLEYSKNKYPRFHAENLVYLSKIYLLWAQYDRAAVVLKECELVASQNNFQEILLETYREYISLSQKTGNYRQEANFRRKFIKQKKKLYNTSLAQEVAKSEGNFLEEHYQNKIKINNDLSILSRKILSSQNAIYISFNVLALLSTITLILIYKDITLKSRLSRILSQKINERNLILSTRKSTIESLAIKREDLAKYENLSLNTKVQNTRGILHSVFKFSK